MFEMGMNVLGCLKFVFFLILTGYVCNDSPSHALKRCEQCKSNSVSAKFFELC